MSGISAACVGHNIPIYIRYALEVLTTHTHCIYYTLPGIIYTKLQKTLENYLLQNQLSKAKYYPVEIE